MLDLSRLDRQLAVIDENTCIGCARCLNACPVDAILGAAKQMHTVIADQCTGCELCIPPCPVDCIEMTAIRPDNQPASNKALIAEQRHLARQQRLERDEAEHAARLRAKKIAQKKTESADQDPRKLAIAAAIARVQKKKAESARR